MLRVSEQTFFELNKQYHDVKLKDNLYCVIENTREAIFKFIHEYMDRNDLSRFYTKDFSENDIFEDFILYLIKKKPKIKDIKLTRKIGTFSNCLQTFLGIRLKVTKKRPNPRVSKYLPEFVQIQNCWNELENIPAPAQRYSNIDEVVEHEIERIYNNKDYLVGNYLDYNSALFIAMVLGIFDIEFKESLIYFPYNTKEYMINALTCKIRDLSYRVSKRI